MKWRKLAFAVAVFVVVLELVLQIGAVVAALFVVPPKLPAGTGANVLCVGDSFTYGIGASSPEHSYPGALQTQLRARGLQAKVHNGGRPGKDSSVVLRNLPADLVDGIKVLCVLVGGNDFWSHPDLVDASVARPPGAFEWRWRTGRLLQLLTGFTPGTWQQTGPAAEPITLADPAAGFTMLERDGVIPSTPREFLLPPLCPEPPAVEVDRALRMVEAGQARDGLQIATATSEEHPDCAHAWLAVVAAASACGDQALVGSALERLRPLARGGGDAAGSYALLTALGAARHAQEQFDFARQRIAQEPRDILAWKAFQDLAFILGHHEEFLRAAPEALAIAGRLDAGESAIVVRHYARVSCPRDAARSARLIVAALLLDGKLDETRAVMLTVQTLADRSSFVAALGEPGVPTAVRTAVEGVLGELYDGAGASVDAGCVAVLRQHLADMVAIARARGAKTVLVGYPFYREELERAQREVAAELGVPFVDVRERFDRELQHRARPELFVPDGHCNDAGYAIVAELVAEVVGPMLQR